MSCDKCSAEGVVLSDASYGMEEGVVVEMRRREGVSFIEAVGYFDGGYCCGSASVRLSYCPFCGDRVSGDARVD